MNAEHSARLRDDVEMARSRHVDFHLDEVDMARGRLDQIGNALRLHRLHGHEMRYVGAWGDWLTYDHATGRYERDDKAVRVLGLAKSVPDELYREGLGADGTDRKRIIRWADRSSTVPVLRYTLEALRDLPGITVRPHDLDADPAALNCTNGTINLTTGLLEPHDPSRNLTKTTGTEYDPNADAPTWQRFLERTLPDTDVRSYFQRLVGYALHGTVTEHVLALMIGNGANGKTTAANALARTLGDYAGTARKDLLITSKHGQHDTTRTELEGRRFITASEIDAGERLSEAEVKELTGGDRISVRRLYGSPYTVTPTWTIFLHANHRPRVRGTDEGIWRRLRIIEWPVTIPAHERDPQLAERLADEQPGILAWAIAGHAAYREHGLSEPAAVILATESYRASEDTVARFIADTGLILDGSRHTLTITNADLGALLEQWNADTGERLDKKTLHQQLDARGATPYRTGHARGWKGIGRPSLLDTAP